MTVDFGFGDVIDRDASFQHIHNDSHHFPRPSNVCNIKILHTASLSLVARLKVTDSQSTKMSCPNTGFLQSSILSSICIASNTGPNFSIIQADLLNCCGELTIHSTTDGCYTYCNIAASIDSGTLIRCLIEHVDNDLIKAIDFNCDDHSLPTGAPGTNTTTWTMSKSFPAPVPEGTVSSTLIVDSNADAPEATHIQDNSTTSMPFSTGFVVSGASDTDHSRHSHSHTVSASITAPPKSTSTTASASTSATKASEAGSRVRVSNYAAAVMVVFLFLGILA